MTAPMEVRCGKYLGDNDATCPQTTCIRERGHPGLCDNVSSEPAAPLEVRPALERLLTALVGMADEIAEAAEVDAYWEAVAVALEPAQAELTALRERHAELERERDEAERLRAIDERTLNYVSRLEKRNHDRTAAAEAETAALRDRADAAESEARALREALARTIAAAKALKGQGPVDDLSGAFRVGYELTRDSFEKFQLAIFEAERALATKTGGGEP